MKSLVTIAIIILAVIIFLSSCSYETCATYAHHTSMQKQVKKTPTPVKKGHKTRVW